MERLQKLVNCYRDTNNLLLNLIHDKQIKIDTLMADITRLNALVDRLYLCLEVQVTEDLQE